MTSVTELFFPAHELEAYRSFDDELASSFRLTRSDTILQNAKFTMSDVATQVSWNVFKTNARRSGQLLSRLFGKIGGIVTNPKCLLYSH